MQVTIKYALKQGAIAHKEGKLQDAKRIYRAILQVQPLHADANYRLGVLEASDSKIDVALPLFKLALEAGPEVEQYWLSYLDALIKKQQFDVAKETLDLAKKQGVIQKKLNAFEEQLGTVEKVTGSVPVAGKERLSFFETCITPVENKKAQQKLSKDINLSEIEVANFIELYQIGRYDDAEKLALSITKTFPEHSFGWKALGAVLGQKGRKSEALNAVQTAVTLSPNDATAHNNLGNALHELGRLEEAESSFGQAIELAADFAEPHNNLSLTLKELGRLEEAEASLRQAIALRAEFAEAHNNLGVTLQELGRLDEAETSYKQAISLKANYAEAMLNLSIVLDYMNKSKAAILELQNALQIDADNHGLRAGVRLAIHRFLEGKFKDSKKLLRGSSSIQKKLASSFESEKVYQRYLLKILDWHEDKSFESSSSTNNKIIYAIGDSHCLSSHCVSIEHANCSYFCKSQLIKGCKQWDLGNKKQNKFKTKFESIISSLPKSSVLLLTIGEIDCRLDSGIIKHKEKNPEKDIEKLVLTTVGNYLTYIDSKAGDQYHVFIQGVPCPNIDTESHPKKKVGKLIEIIKLFNRELENQAREKGFGFLDIHKLTDRGDGLSNNIWHIDEYHLSPSGIKEAWNKYSS